MKEKFVYPYGADRYPEYEEFRKKEEELLETYNKQVAEKPYLKDVCQLRYYEGTTELFEKYAHILKYMDVEQFMKEWNLEIGKIYGVKEKDGRILIALKLIKAEGTYLYFEDGTRHCTSGEFRWTEIDESELKKDVPEEKKEFGYDDYSEWSRTLALNYDKKHLEKEWWKCVKLTPKYAAWHLRVIKKTTSMQSNSQGRAQAGNSVVANYERKKAFHDALEIYERFPEKTKDGLQE